jgi:hypothetical protein
MKSTMLIRHAESYRSQPIPRGVRVRSSGGKLHVSDGPFTEAKEVVGGYALVEVKTREEALDMARQFMDLHRGRWPEFEGDCGVRPLEDM